MRNRISLEKRSGALLHDLCLVLYDTMICMMEMGSNFSTIQSVFPLEAISLFFVGERFEALLSVEGLLIYCFPAFPNQVECGEVDPEGI